MLYFPCIWQRFQNAPCTYICLVMLQTEVVVSTVGYFLPVCFRARLSLLGPDLLLPNPESCLGIQAEKGH